MRRIVKLSSIAAEPGAPVAFWDWHGRIEQHLRRSGVPGVVLRSSFFMSNVLAAAEQVARRRPALRARARREDRDGRPARRRRSSGRRGHDGPGHDGRTYVAHRARGDHL